MLCHHELDFELVPRKKLLAPEPARRYSRRIRENQIE